MCAVHVPGGDTSLGGPGTPESLPWISLLCAFLSNGDSGRTTQAETGVSVKAGVIGLITYF